MIAERTQQTEGLTPTHDVRVPEGTSQAWWYGIMGMHRPVIPYLQREAAVPVPRARSTTSTSSRLDMQVPQVFHQGTCLGTKVLTHNNSWLVARTTVAAAPAWPARCAPSTIWPALLFQQQRNMLVQGMSGHPLRLPSLHQDVAGYTMHGETGHILQCPGCFN